MRGCTGSAGHLPRETWPQRPWEYLAAGLRPRQRLVGPRPRPRLRGLRRRPRLPVAGGPRPRLRLRRQCIWASRSDLRAQRVAPGRLCPASQGGAATTGMAGLRRRARACCGCLAREQGVGGVATACEPVTVTVSCGPHGGTVAWHDNQSKPAGPEWFRRAHPRRRSPWVTQRGGAAPPRVAWRGGAAPPRMNWRGHASAGELAGPRLRAARAARAGGPGVQNADGATPPTKRDHASVPKLFNPVSWRDRARTWQFASKSRHGRGR